MRLWYTILGVWVVDRLLKMLIQAYFLPHDTLVIIPKVFHITYVLNPGAAFGLMAGRTWIFIITAILVFLGVIVANTQISPSEKLFRYSLGMIGGGALGNLYDRMAIGGKVVDYLDFKIWPFVFNFADSMIVIGVGLLLLRFYFQERKGRD